MSDAASMRSGAGAGGVIGATGGAVGLSAAVAVLGTCCVAPWAVGLIGVTGAVALARLAAWTPLLIGGAFACLGHAFYFAYRPLPDCADGACRPTTRRRLGWVAWGGAIAVAAALAIDVMPYL